MRGNRRSIARRGLIVVLCIQCLMLTAWSGAARADDLLLMAEPPKISHTLGWMWLGLSLVSLGVAANDYEESQYNIKQTRTAYAHYQAATNAADAIYWRNATSDLSHKAVAYESSANAGLALGALFAIAAIATFRYTGADNTPMLLSQRGIELEFRF